VQPPPLAPRRPRNPWIPLVAVGAAALAMFVAAGTCVTLLVTQTDTDVLRVALDDVQPGGARLVPLTRFGADEAGRTQGLWVVRPDEATALALLAVDPHSGCRVEWRADQELGGVSPILRDPCTGSIYDGAGGRIFGPAPRGLDRFPASIDFDARQIEVEMDRLQLGACALDTVDSAACTSPPRR
jgi:Rieske Fe-S protein